MHSSWRSIDLDPSALHFLLREAVSESTKGTSSTGEPNCYKHRFSYPTEVFWSSFTEALREVFLEPERHIVDELSETGEVLQQRQMIIESPVRPLKNITARVGLVAGRYGRSIQTYIASTLFHQVLVLR